MTEETLLDRAHAAMEAAPDDDALRLRFFERLADSELFLLLAKEAEGEEVTPELLDITDARFVLVFDREARLAAFTNHAAPYVAMSGRALAALLAQNGLGLGLNLEVAPSSFLLPPDGVTWLSEALDQRPEEVQQAVSRVFGPSGLPEDLLTALDTKLASASGLAASAYLVGVEYENGARGHMLGIMDAVPGAETALAQAVSEVLRFSGLEAAALDVAFFSAEDGISARLAKEGLRFDLPRPEPREISQTGQGLDPEKPPILR